MPKQFHVVVWQETQHYVAKVLENSVSSFGVTEEEALRNTKEALDLYLEDASNTMMISSIVQPRMTTISYA